MALKDYLNVIDNQLKAVFDRKSANPTKMRRPLLRGIDRALAQFRSGSTGAAKGWWRLKNGVVALTVKVDGNTFDINGVATNHMPADRFEEFLERMRAAVEAGEFDAELANKGNGNAEVHITKRKAPTISPEAAKARGAKAAATRKANRAKATGIV
jgi:Tfp pilus assembly protein PilN